MEDINAAVPDLDSTEPPADLLADAPADRARIRDPKVDIAFLDYDWALNDAGA